MADMSDIFGSDSENEDARPIAKAKTEESESGEDALKDNEKEAIHTEDESSENTKNENSGEDAARDESDNDEDDDVVSRKKPAETTDVFGDELADLSEDSDENNDKDEAHEAEAEEEEEEQVIDIEIPKLKTDLGKEIHFVKLPNFLSVEPKPFEAETYEDETPKDEALDEEGQARVRLKVENTIRWKYEKDEDGNYIKDEEGNLIKQSNSKMIKWSDGSMSLYLGNEIFDVYHMPMIGDHNHLFVRQGTVLQGQAVFRTKLSFRPHSIDSLTHRKMTMSLVDRGSKTKKVKILTEISKNPENTRQEMIKKEEEKLKAASRRQNQQRRLREKSHSKGLSAAYLEDRDHSDDEGAISLSAIKNKFKRGSRNDSKASIYSSSDESDRERRLNKAKLNEDDFDDEDDDEREDDDRLGSKKSRSAQKKKMKKVVSDDEDD